MADVNLLQELPNVLDEALKGAISNGERIVIALPGAMGEALAVTDLRIAVLREKATMNGVDVFSYPLAAVTGVETWDLTTGGMIRFVPKENVPDERRTVYFPTDRRPAFQAATERIKQLQTQPETDQVKRPELAAGSACPSCGAQVGERHAFCSACGAQVRDVCRVCSTAMPNGTKFCPGCGMEAKPAVTKCGTCGARINETVISYCPQCGTAVSTKCISCGAAIIAGWPRCRFCGREIGSMEGITPRGVRAAVRGHVTEEGTVQQKPTDTGGNAAAEHNASGAKLFDEEKFEEAIEEFRRAVMLEPENGEYHCNLAVAYDEIDEDDDARREYERALELNPNDTTAMLYLGYMLNENGEQAHAAELWKRLTEVAPGSPEAEEAAQNLRTQGDL